MARLAGAAKVVDPPELPPTMVAELVAAGLSEEAAGEVVEVTRRHVINHRLIASFPRTNEATRKYFRSIQKSAANLSDAIAKICADENLRSILERSLTQWGADLGSIHSGIEILRHAAETDENKVLKLHGLDERDESNAKALKYLLDNGQIDADYVYRSRRKVRRLSAAMPADKGGAAVPSLAGLVSRLAGIYERDTGRAAGRSRNDYTGYGGPFLRMVRVVLGALPDDAGGGKRSDEAVNGVIRDAMDLTRQ